MTAKPFPLIAQSAEGPVPAHAFPVALYGMPNAEYIEFQNGLLREQIQGLRERILVLEGFHDVPPLN